MGLCMPLEGKFAMAKKICWAVIFITIAVNVVMLQWTIEAYLGLEYEKIYVYSTVAVISVICALVAFFIWRKHEYHSN